LNSVTFRQPAQSSRREARLQAGFRSAQKFAEFMGIEPAAYRRYERGDSMPTLDKLTRICQALVVTPNYLLPDAVSVTAPRPSNEGAA